MTQINDERKPKVLLVEDNPINQKVASIYLKKMGCETEIAENGKEGVEKFKRSKYDVILMDVNMPIMDGIQATFLIREIERTRNNGIRTNIVAVTANAFNDDKNRCLESGMDQFISKPYLSSDLEKAFSALQAG